MTEPQQRRFFFPAWTAACRALGWRMADGRLQMGKPGAEIQRQLDNPHIVKVINAATSIANAQHRAVTVDDLRHGCYVVALGRDMDTLKLNNKQVDAVTSLFRLLVNDADIAADLRLGNPDIGERERLVITIKRLNIPMAMIDTICKRSFAPVYTSPFWDDLPLPNLRALVGILTEVKSRKEEGRMKNAETKVVQPF